MNTEIHMVQKTTQKSQTPKQMAIKVESILRGLDNSQASIGKHQKKIDDGIEELKPLLAGLANAATAKPAAKPVQAKPAAKAPAPAKPAAKPQPAKAAKAAKPAVKPAKPTAKAPKSAKPAKTAAKVKDGKKEPVPGRPILKEAIKEMIAAEGGKGPAAKLYHRAIDKYGYWSRQGFYAALKDTKSFTHTSDDQYEVVQTADEVEKFVDQASKNQAVAHVS